MTMSPCPCTVAEVFVLGLDACGRALAYFQHRSRLNVEPEASLVSAKYEELANLAMDLRNLSKNETLRQTKRSQAVKKQLKQVVQSFQGLTSNDAQMFDLATKDSFLTLEYPVLNRAPDFNPEIPHSLTDSASSTVSRESSANEMMFPPFGPFSQKELDEVSASDLASILDPKVVEMEWAGTDMIGLGGVGSGMGGDLSGFEFPEMINGNLSRKASDQVNHGHGMDCQDSEFR